MHTTRTFFYLQLYNIIRKLVPILFTQSDIFLPQVGFEENHVSFGASGTDKA